MTEVQLDYTLELTEAVEKAALALKEAQSLYDLARDAMDRARVQMDERGEDLGNAKNMLIHKLCGDIGSFSTYVKRK